MMSVAQLAPARPSSAKLQTKNTLLSNTRAPSTTNVSSSLLTNDTNAVPKRTRTISTSSIDTIRTSSGKKKTSSSKKRARATESSQHGELDRDLLEKLENIRRTRQRKSSTCSTDTVRAPASAIAFPTLPSSDERPASPRSEPDSTTSKVKGKAGERKATPPKLNPGHAAPSVAVTSDSGASSTSLDMPAPTASRHAPPPPIANVVRSRVSSMKTHTSRPASPAQRVVVPSSYRTTGFEPLPLHLQDWQPSSSLSLSSDDEDSVYDGDASSTGASWKDQWNNLHPGMSDLDLSISFHKKQPFFDVWDLPDDIYIGVPARLHLTLRDPQEWKGRSLYPEPDLRYIDIKCNSFEYRSVSSMCGDSYPPEYSVIYNGAASTEYADPTIVPADLTRGIIVNKKWSKTFPGNKTRTRDSLITNFGRLPDDSIGAQVEEDEDIFSKRGWFFKFMIPIPSWVLRQGNSRAFTVEASAWVGGLDDGGLLRGDSELVISHLRSEREMAKGHGQNP